MLAIAQGLVSRWHQLEAGPTRADQAGPYWWAAQPSADNAIKPTPHIRIATRRAGLSPLLAVMRVAMRLHLSAVRVLGAATAVGLVGAGVISMGTAAAAPRAACSGLGTQPPNVGSRDLLSGVATTSACNAWAVDYYFAKGGRTKPLIEHWNGRAWKVQPSPNPGGSSRLTGVAATSAKNAWAVGSGPGGAVIEHWNGSVWTDQLSRCHKCGLRAAAATSAKNAWAVGSGGGAGFTLIEHWNGKAWKIQRSACPLSADTCELGAVAATSATNAWAVGSEDNRSRGGLQMMLIEHWNGKAWRVQRSRQPRHDNGGALTGVAATSATNAWAVGSYARVGVSAGLTFIEHWNGQAWKVRSSRNPGARERQ